MISKSQQTHFVFAAADGIPLFVYRWIPEQPPRGVVQIAHGLAEHAGRYARLAQALNNVGYAVYANDQRGHGRSARGPDELGYFVSNAGLRRCVEDLWNLNRSIAHDYPRLPVVLLGHSMGSFMAQRFICDYGDALAGVVLCGSPGMPPARVSLLRLLACLERWRVGPRGRSSLLTGLLVGAFNRSFKPARTSWDWLSRDTAEVDKYIADPFCRGFRPAVQLWIDLLGALRDATSPECLAMIPQDLPIYVISGTRDPISSSGRGVEKLLEAYRNAGLMTVRHMFYPEARHELFNEINRDEVTQDLISWLREIDSPEQHMRLPSGRGL